MLHHLVALARPRERHVEHGAEPRVGTVRHHRDAIGEEQRLVDVVRDHQRRRALGAPELEQHFLQLDARQRVEHAERLVEQQHARRQRERARDADALLHALRQLAPA